MDGRATKTGLHALIWTLFLMLPVLIVPNIFNLISNNSCHFFNYITFSVLLVLFFYFNYYFATPRYYFKQKYLAFIGVHLAFILGVFIIVILLNLIIGPCLVTGDLYKTPIRTLSRNILPRHILVFIVSFSLRVDERLKAIDTEKTKADLQLLRTQINPHFLFNVLNTIYGQAIIKSAHTADSIAKLSDLMRYSLKEANVPMVALDKEIAYLESYISLQKLRLTDKTTVEFHVKGNNTALQIPPMLFIPFIENAFKYGVSNEVETTIKIIIEVVDKQVNLLVENTKLPNKTQMRESYQIGLNNVKSRLDLIYDNKYTLNISDTANNYRVQLKITT